MFAPIPVREVKGKPSYSVRFITQPHAFLRQFILYPFQGVSQVGFDDFSSKTIEQERIFKKNPKSQILITEIQRYKTRLPRCARNNRLEIIYILWPDFSTRFLAFLRSRSWGFDRNDED